MDYVEDIEIRAEMERIFRLGRKFVDNSDRQIIMGLLRRENTEIFDASPSGYIRKLMMSGDMLIYCEEKEGVAPSGPKSLPQKFGVPVCPAFGCDRDPAQMMPTCLIHYQEVVAEVLGLASEEHSSKSEIFTPIPQSNTTIPRLGARASRSSVLNMAAEIGEEVIRTNMAKVSTIISSDNQANAVGLAKGKIVSVVKPIGVTSESTRNSKDLHRRGTRDATKKDRSKSETNSKSNDRPEKSKTADNRTHQTGGLCTSVGSTKGRLNSVNNASMIKSKSVSECTSKGETNVNITKSISSTISKGITPNPVAVPKERSVVPDTDNNKFENLKDQDKSAMKTVLSVRQGIPRKLKRPQSSDESDHDFKTTPDFLKRRKEEKRLRLEAETELVNNDKMMESVNEDEVLEADMTSAENDNTILGPSVPGEYPRLDKNEHDGTVELEVSLFAGLRVNSQQNSQQVQPESVESRAEKDKTGCNEQEVNSPISVSKECDVRAKSLTSAPKQGKPDKRTSQECNMGTKPMTSPQNKGKNDILARLAEIKLKVAMLKNRPN